MATNIGIWPGSGSAISGSTPFGTYDAESNFQLDGPKIADWVARRLGYPIVQIELKDTQIYACFEEAINEYSTQINNTNVKNWMLTYYGQPTGSDLTHKYPTNTINFGKRYAAWVSTEIGAGGDIDWKTGSIVINKDQQEYDLQTLWGNPSESNQHIEIREVWHYPPAAMNKFYSPQLSITQDLIMTEFGGSSFGGVGRASKFVVRPVYADVLRAQAIELSDQIRKSQYSYEIINNKLRIFPPPEINTTLYFRYTVNDDPLNTDRIDANEISNGISGPSDITFEYMNYNRINSMGKTWIRKYTLALTKELLGHIRSKYSSIPIPDSEVTLDGSELISSADQDKQQLLEELRDFLEQTNNQALLESERDKQQALMETFAKSPLKVYIG